MRKKILCLLLCSCIFSSTQVFALTTQQKLIAKTGIGLALTALGVGGIMYFEEGKDPRLEFLDAMSAKLQEEGVSADDFAKAWIEALEAEGQADVKTAVEEYATITNQDGVYGVDVKMPKISYEQLVLKKLTKIPGDNQEKRKELYGYLMEVCRDDFEKNPVLNADGLKTKRRISLAVGGVGAFIALKNGYALYKNWRESKKAEEKEKKEELADKLEKANKEDSAE